MVQILINFIAVVLDINPSHSNSSGNREYYLFVIIHMYPSICIALMYCFPEKYITTHNHTIAFSSNGYHKGIGTKLLALSINPFNQSQHAL